MRKVTNFIMNMYFKMLSGSIILITKLMRFSLSKVKVIVKPKLSRGKNKRVKFSRKQRTHRTIRYSCHQCRTRYKKLRFNTATRAESFKYA